MQPRCRSNHKFFQVKRTFATSSKSENQISRWRSVFEECAAKRQLSSLDWYTHNPSSLLDERAQSILKYEFNGSLFHALSTLFPEKEWLPWKFKSENIPSSYWKSVKNQRKFFDVLGRELGVSHLDDWYEKLNAKLLMEHAPGIRTLHGSAIVALKAAYPEHNWLPWKFNSTYHGFWKEIQNQREFFDWLGKELGVKELDDWYKVLTRKVVLEHGGSFLNSFYNGSPIDALKSCYPEHNWVPWKFKSTPQGFWKSPENHRKFFDWLGQQQGLKHLDDWYAILSTKLVLDNGGYFFFMYNSSVIEALKRCYPEHNWLTWKFQHATQKFWNNPENHRQFFDWLGKELGVQHLDDWYKVSNLRTIIKMGGSFILEKYHGSPLEALKACYPEHNWIPWKFTNTPQSFWKSKENQRQFFDWLGQQLGVKELDDWYKLLTVDDVMESGGAGFTNQYSSVADALVSCYPEREWDIWKFEKCNAPKYYWNSEKNMIKFLSDLSEKLSIQTLDDWYRVDMKQLQRFGAGYVIQRYGGLFGALSQIYPHHPWNPLKFRTQKKAQRWLLVTLAKMFPSDEILEDFLHPQFTSKRPLQLDAFIPSKSLAFEYQGEQHFQDIHVFQSQRAYKERDQEKRIQCAKNNITLIEVPYWWDRTEKGLQKIMEEYTGSISIVK